MKTGNFRGHVAQSPKKEHAWVALVLILALTLGSSGAIPSAALAAQDSGPEQPFPEVAGPNLESVALGPEPGVRYTDVSAFYVERLRAQRDSLVSAQDSGPEQPFPEVAGPKLESVAPGTEPGVRYTGVSAFYVERLRAQRDSLVAALDSGPEPPFPEVESCPSC